jgi:hypothetical protein
MNTFNEAHFPTSGERFDAAPTELITIIGPKSYKDLAPTERASGIRNVQTADSDPA